jgi:hypothetical protein
MHKNNCILYIYIFRAIFAKIQKSDLKNSKHSKFLYPTRFSYVEFNENHKLKFLDFKIYFLMRLHIDCNANVFTIVSLYI